MKISAIHYPNATLVLVSEHATYIVAVDREDALAEVAHRYGVNELEQEEFRTEGFVVDSFASHTPYRVVDTRKPGVQSNNPTLIQELFNVDPGLATDSVAFTLAQVDESGNLSIKAVGTLDQMEEMLGNKLLLQTPVATSNVEMFETGALEMDAPPNDASLLGTATIEAADEESDTADSPKKKSKRENKKEA